jgi:hypothetical protein
MPEVGDVRLSKETPNNSRRFERVGLHGPNRKIRLFYKSRTTQK